MNHCDLEETKKVALDKFIELCNEPEKWQEPIEAYVDFCCGGFELGSFNCASFGTFVSLNGINILYQEDPSLSFFRSTDYPLYEEAKAKYNNHPAVIAAKKVYKYREQLVYQEKCEILLAGLKGMTLRLILDTDPDFPADLREKMSRPWWKFWA